MSLSEFQKTFAYNAAKLVIYAFDVLGYTCTLGEALRTPEQAEIYAKQGKGTINSLHLIKLAIDLNLFDKNGNYLTKTEDYSELGMYWKSLNPKNRWGGDSKFRADGNHFSMAPDGVRA